MKNSITSQLLIKVRKFFIKDIENKTPVHFRRDLDSLGEYLKVKI